MDKKRIVCCTSTGCIEYAPDRYKNKGIEIFHIIVNYEGKDYYEGLDLNPHEFFLKERTIENPKDNLPHSAIPEIADIRKKFESFIEKGYEEAIIITLSSYLGGTYNTIKLISEEYKDKITTYMIDAKTTCFNEGLLAIQAKDLVDKGVDTLTILKELKWSIDHQAFVGICGSLDYLIYNGRLKGGKAFMGKLLSITPVMNFTKDGVLEAFSSAVGLKKGAIASIARIKEIIGDRDPKDYILFHNYSGEGSADILKKLEEAMGVKVNHEDMIASPVTGCHTGPELAGYGLFMVRREDEPLE